MQNIDKYILWLTIYEGLTPLKKFELYKYFKSAKAVYEANLYQLMASDILTEYAAKKLIGYAKNNNVSKTIERCIKENIKFITIEDKSYPLRLTKIPDPPLGLFVIGDFPDDRNRSVAIIGSRGCSIYGATQAYKFGKEFAKNGITVVSGLALGVDAKSHLGSIDGGGKTIAVLGCGIDRIYPIENTPIKEKIVKNGCIITEFPFKSLPLKSHFPQRNRIISGLSDAVCVVEATAQSGTLITVNHALEQGRDVFAVPGNITSKFSEGCNNLLKMGAYPLTIPQDLYDVISFNPLVKYEDKNNEFSLETEEKIVYDCIGLEPMSVEELLIKTNSQAQTIGYILTILELKGFVLRLSGQRIMRSL